MTGVKRNLIKCLSESEKDPAFNFFVVMMQPTDTLVNLSGTIERFTKEKTYLVKEDKDKFRKIAEYLACFEEPRC